MANKAISNENGAVALIVSFSPFTLQRRIRFDTLSAHPQVNSTHAHFNISVREIGAKLKATGSICPPFWILTLQ